VLVNSAVLLTLGLSSYYSQVVQILNGLLSVRMLLASNQSINGNWFDLIKILELQTYKAENLFSLLTFGLEHSFPFTNSLPLCYMFAKQWLQIR